MSERGMLVSEIVAQLVSDARRQEGLSMDELADRAGVHRTYVGLLERRSRQPTLAVAANLAEALGLSLSELVAEAEQDADDGYAPHVELVPAPSRRQLEPAHLGESPHLEAATGLTAATVARAVEVAYRKLDLIDEQMRASGSRPIVALIDLPELSSLMGNLLSAAVARASNGLYVQNGPDHSPNLLPVRQGLPELEVATALETERPTGAARNAGLHLVLRYVLADRSGAYTRGEDSRGDTVAVWEIRFGDLTEADYTGSARANGRARLKKEALDRMELVYYDPALLPYARATGVYARSVRA
jgi:transcriptional regulator with XRE-family HTH domain